MSDDGDVATATDPEERRYWVQMLLRVVKPVLTHLACRQLKQAMPIESVGDARYEGGRTQFSHLEAMARSLCGLAPWLECRATADAREEAERAGMAALARAAIDAATDPSSADFVNFSYSFQPIVDAAFLCHALLRAPTELCAKLEPRVRDNLITALKATRSRKAHYNNWLLFAAMIEVGLKQLGAADWDPSRVDYGLRSMENWHLGDGLYGDGDEYHADYYNSFVIQPFLVDIIAAVGGEYADWEALRRGITKRARRYGEVLERCISPEGTFPPLGRSLAYRCGAMQHLAQMALQHQLSVPPEQVRGALGAVIRRSLGAPGTFDDAGWLRLGFCGAQPEVAEMYISTGSLYLCSAAFLPLGLGACDSFWAAPPRDWTAKRMWAGGHAPVDHALDHVAI